MAKKAQPPLRRDKVGAAAPEPAVDSRPLASPEAVLEIKAWPRLIQALRDPALAYLGTSPEDVARFLLIRALDERMREDAQHRAAQDKRIAALGQRW
jgi:hypothetical protein